MRGNRLNHNANVNSGKWYRSLEKWANFNSCFSERVLCRLAKQNHLRPVTEVCDHRPISVKSLFSSIFSEIEERGN